MTSDQGLCDDTPTVNYFSNPEVTYNGIPTGDDDNNNAQTIRDNMVNMITSNPSGLAVSYGVNNSFLRRLRPLRIISCSAVVV